MCCRCLRLNTFCFSFSLNAGCILVGWYLSLEAFLLLISSIAWVNEQKKYEGGDPWEKSAYAAGGIWLLGTAVTIIVGVGKKKPMHLQCASVLMIVPITALAVDSMMIFSTTKSLNLFANVIPLALMPYFIILLCSNAAHIKDERRGYVSGRQSQMGTECTTA